MLKLKQTRKTTNIEMRKKNLLLFILLTLLSMSSFSQTDNIEFNDSYYFTEKIDANMIKKLIKKGVLSDSLVVTSKYLDKETKGLNKKGSKIFNKIQIKEHLSYFKDYVYLQHVEYKNNIYVLYYTMEGISKGINNGTAVWSIVRFEKENWNLIKKLKKKKLNAKNNSFKLIISSQDIVPMLFYDPNERIFIKNDYLILERADLFHSLYDLQTDKIIINEVSPWLFTGKENKENRIEWIRKNLHEKIETYLYEDRK